MYACVVRVYTHYMSCLFACLYSIVLAIKFS